MSDARYVADSFDVAIIGAGLSGIGAACHLQRECPGKTFVILEARHAIGGTWDLFRYPGVRSDSDMHTLGYDFKPWLDAKAIADGPAILRYVEEAAEENGIAPHIRFGHRVTKAHWRSDRARWRLEAQTQGGSVAISANMLLMCGGYYRYDAGHMPRFAGIERFQGPVIHPQAWPEDLDYAGKRVVIIGSGATAMTLAPAMAEGGAQVTMVQRSPTYVVSRPSEDALANALRRCLPPRLAYAATRWKNVALGRWFYRLTRTRPDKVRDKLLGLVRHQLGPDYDVQTHFAPRYDPWDQRLCLVPDSDLFRAIKSGALKIVTDATDGFTERGLALGGGREIDADIIVAATGLRLQVMAGIAVSVDGRAVDFSQTCTYKGCMFSDVPNLVQTFGYVNASWTLRADLIAHYACRLLNRMDAFGARQCTPRLGESERSMAHRPWIDDFSAGYIQRSLAELPRQGDRAPWLNVQDYAEDRKLLLDAPIEDGVLQFDEGSGAKPADIAAKAA